MVFRRRDRPPFLVRVREFLVPRRGYLRGYEYIGHRVRRIPDTPHRIALGFACGVYASFTPFFGAHFFLAAGLAWALRGNVVASLIGTAAGNPFTFPFIASTSMALGRQILGYGATGRDFGRVTDAFLQAAVGLWEAGLYAIGLGPPVDWAKLTLFFTDVMLPYFVGGLLPGIVASIASYYVVRPLIRGYQAARRLRLERRAKERAGSGEADAGRGAPYDPGT